ncbi:nucleotidyltransferase/DNA polymerase involved in DNA repair [Rhizobium mongolense]|uniref:Nucleotidyltransferase/DNA polymerase involved in DNA repair n=1 Tax=Rhizobium mongolense TaxID=57676 RepID=A0A7W6WG38_9HYPH|nr:nucleotidyltransferase/DNA polymerase involved in DNA repair [Rhizobium mongolense]
MRVGPATAEKMRRLGIESGADLRSKDVEFLLEHFGKDYTFTASRRAIAKTRQTGLGPQIGRGGGYFS